MPKVKRSVPEFTSVPTMPSSRPSTITPIALSTAPLREHDGADKPEHHQREILGAPNCSAELCERRRGDRDDQRRDGAGEERAERGDRQRRAGPALPRHLVAVEASSRPTRSRPAG